MELGLERNGLRTTYQQGPTYHRTRAAADHNSIIITCLIIDTSDALVVKLRIIIFYKLFFGRGSFYQIQ